jgi:hypothetical protein
METDLAKTSCMKASFRRGLPSAAAGIACAAMPRIKPPDISDIDPSELMLAVLAVLDERHCGPEWRKVMRASQLGDLLEHCGGAKQVLAAALAAVRRGR